MGIIIKRPVISEKSISQGTKSRYTFLVDKQATRRQIKDAVSKLFHVTVVAVNIARLPGKAKKFKRIAGRRSERKHAIVTLKQGETIALFEEKKS